MFSPKRKGTSFSPRVVGGKQKGESLLRWCQHCDPKWPRLLVSSTCIHISTQVRKKVDTRSFHRKHSFHRKRKGFLCGGNSWHSPYIKNLICQLVPPSEGTVETLMFSPKRKGTSFSPPDVTGTLPPSVIGRAKPVIWVDLRRHQKVEIWCSPASSPLMHEGIIKPTWTV